MGKIHKFAIICSDFSKVKMDTCVNSSGINVTFNILYEILWNVGKNKKRIEVVPGTYNHFTTVQNQFSIVFLRNKIINIVLLLRITAIFDCTLVTIKTFLKVWLKPCFIIACHDVLLLDLTFYWVIKCVWEIHKFKIFMIRLNM